MQGSNYQIDKKPLLDIPIIKPTNIKPFVRLVEYIIYIKSLEENSTPNLEMIEYFEQVINGLIYELYFTGLLKEHDCIIMTHIDELPSLVESMDKKQKNEIISQVYLTLNDKEHPVRINLERLKGVEEIATIEESI